MALLLCLWTATTATLNDQRLFNDTYLITDDGHVYDVDGHKLVRMLCPRVVFVNDGRVYCGNGFTTDLYGGASEMLPFPITPNRMDYGYVTSARVGRLWAHFAIGPDGEEVHSFNRASPASSWEYHHGTIACRVFDAVEEVIFCSSPVTGELTVHTPTTSWDSQRDAYEIDADPEADVLYTFDGFTKSVSQLNLTDIRNNITYVIDEWFAEVPGQIFGLGNGTFMVAANGGSTRVSYKGNCLVIPDRPVPQYNQKKSSAVVSKLDGKYAMLFSLSVQPHNEQEYDFYGRYHIFTEEDLEQCRFGWEETLSYPTYGPVAAFADSAQDKYAIFVGQGQNSLVLVIHDVSTGTETIEPLKGDMEGVSGIYKGESISVITMVQCAIGDRCQLSAFFLNKTSLTVFNVTVPLLGEYLFTVLHADDFFTVVTKETLITFNLTDGDVLSRYAIDFSGFLGGTGRFYGDYLFLGNSKSLSLVDFQNPAEPEQMVSSYKLPYNETNAVLEMGPRYIYVFGDDLGGDPLMVLEPRVSVSIPYEVRSTLDGHSSRNKYNPVLYQHNGMECLMPMFQTDSYLAYCFKDGVFAARSIIENPPLALIPRNFVVVGNQVFWLSNLTADSLVQQLPDVSETDAPSTALPIPYPLPREPSKGVSVTVVVFVALGVFIVGGVLVGTVCWFRSRNRESGSDETELSRLAPVSECD